MHTIIHYEFEIETLFKLTRIGSGLGLDNRVDMIKIKPSILVKANSLRFISRVIGQRITVFFFRYLSN